MSEPIVLSYFTSAAYLEHGRAMVRSCQEHELAVELHKVADQGGWQANTQHKARFLLQQRQRPDLAGRPIIWLDADARVRQRPELFEELARRRVDLAAHRFLGRQLCSGTLFIGSDPNAETILQRWVERCAEKPKELDQESLDKALRGLPDGVVTFEELPASYCFIFDLSRQHYPGAEPVIEHLQASRTERKKP